MAGRVCSRRIEWYYDVGKYVKMVVSEKHNKKLYSRPLLEINASINLN